MVKIKNIDITEDEDIEIELSDDETNDDGSLESTDTPESSLEEGEAKEDKGKVETEEKSTDKSKSTEKETSIESDDDDSDPTYKGKTREQIIQMHQEASKKLGKQGEELGRARTEHKETESKNIVEQMSLDDLRAAHKKLSSEMIKLDPEFDKERYDELADAIAQSEQDILDKRHTMLINEQISSKENSEFIDKHKTVFKEKGFFIGKDGVFDDDGYNEVIEQAKNYTDNGRLTENSVYKAMIDLHGFEKIGKVLEISTEQSTRERIKNAADKIDNKIDSKGKGSESESRKVVKFNQMSPMERDRFLDGLSMEEVESLESAVNKLSGKR